MKKTFHVKAPKQRLSALICAECAISLPQALRLIRGGETRLDGVKMRTDIVVNSDAEISVFVPQKFLQKEPIKWTQIYADENILVVDKPVGCLVEEELLPSIRQQFGTAVAVHRLDRNTSGVMVFALNPGAEASLLAGFKTHSIVKLYTAVVNGRVDKPQRLEAYLLKNATDAIVTIVDKPQRTARRIVTEFDVVSSAPEYSVLCVKLISGRTHQIRAHLAHIGHFVLGDGKYGDDRINRRYKLKAQLLRAQKIVMGSLEPPLAYLEGKEFEVSPLQWQTPRPKV